MHTQEATLSGPLNPGNPEQEAMLVGWPYTTSTAPNTQTLKKATFRIMSRENCLAVANVTNANEFCTENVREFDVGQISSCDGNIGSPLYIDKPGSDFVVGILIKTPVPCDSTVGFTGIYARVANYRRWISGVVDQ